MKTPSALRSALPRLLIATGFAATLVQPALAQSTSATTPSGSDDTVVLSPFVVNTSKDVGYVANTTLSGTRTNTDLKDVANPLDVFTSELMRDLSIQDIQDLTLFANGVEPNGAGGFNSDGQEREVWNYNYMQIRGFKTGVLTRNFMDLNAQFEAYNSERVEFSKGPNAILAGSGNPGGTVNYATKTPRLQKSSYAVEHRTSDLGNQRVSTDLNQVLVANKLAIRLNALWEDEESYRHPSYEKQEAWHLTGSWQPWRGTTLTAGYEDRDSKRASPRGIFARDRVTAWKNAGSPIVTAVPSNNNVVVAGLSGTRAASTLGMATLNGTNWVLDSDGVIRNTVRTARGDVISVNTVNLDTAATSLDFPRDVWIGGANGINDSRWKIAEANLTQQITPDLFLEVAYGDTDNRVRQGNSVSRELYVDPNSFGDNTHPGQLYAETRPFWIDRGIYINHFRTTASYNLDLTKRSKWLGKHSFAAAYEHNEREEWQDNGRLTLTQTPTGPVTGSMQSAPAFNIRDYIDIDRGIISQRDLRDLYYSDGIEQGGYVARFVRRESYAAVHTLTKQNSMLGVWQSRWLEDRIVGTIGLREDRRAEAVAPMVLDATGIWVPQTLVAGTPAGSTHPRYAAFTAAPKYDSGISRNYGVVGHATRWLSFAYNHATNFSPRVESRGLFGDYLEPSTGESNDYSMRLSLLDDRVSVTLTHYETSEIGSATNGTGINSPVTAMSEIEDILVDNGLSTVNPIVGVWTTADRTAKGEELLIVGNPTPNWTFRLSANRLVNRQQNLAPDVRAYYAERMPFYEAQNPALISPGETLTLGDRITQAKTAYGLMNTRENVQVFPASEYNAQATAKYSFGRESRFKGLALGGTTSWNSAPIIGYYRNANNTFDAARPVEGADRLRLDFVASYERRLAKRVLWRVQLNVYNVFDNDDPYPIGAVNSADNANFTWVNTTYRPMDGRIITLTNTFTF
ncbi:MAG: TonB-dependent receptor plug domain-containing protein [Opitutae bacterium]|nr:TonB-dependent receptor plug domain-containing protein [Opitutae bacterium]